MSRTQMLLLSVLVLICLPPVLLAMIWFAAIKNENRFRIVALALDCAGNAATNGDYRETISSRAGRRWPRMARFVNWLFADPHHCTNAIEFTRHELTRGL
jgi:hypothetical protein